MRTHRDIKPANILVDKKGRVKIADFGLAKIAGVEDGRLTRTNQGMGTMMYTAPEQMENAKNVDHRADIYSLGVVFYEMLTGELPMGRFANPSQTVGVDVRFDEIVLHALERDVERRYQHVSEVKTAVEGVTGTPGTKPLPSTAEPASAPKVDILDQPTKEALYVGRGVMSVLGMWAALGCFIAVGGLGLSIWLLSQEGNLSHSDSDYMNIMVGSAAAAMVSISHLPWLWVPGVRGGRGSRKTRRFCSPASPVCSCYALRRRSQNFPLACGYSSAGFLSSPIFYCASTRVCPRPSLRGEPRR